MTNNELVARVQGLTKRYGDLTAVGGIDLEIRRGEILSLLGPNGAGKSTTIEILEGFRDATSGTVEVLGVDPARGGRDWRARLGIVLQSSGLPEEMTVREVVAHFATLYPRRRGVDETIDAVGLTEKSGVRIQKLSGGQKRRVDVALGIIGRPELLFLDEPTTGFDPQARRDFWTLIRQVRDEGTTVLLTTHYLDEAAQLADRAVVITRGHVVAEGPIDELGGEDARIPTVTWRDAGRRHEVRTAEPSSLVAQLHATQGELDDLQVLRPSLEDIYLDLVREDEGVPPVETRSQLEPALG